MADSTTVGIPTPPVDRGRLRRRLVTAGGMLAVAASASLALDVTVARWCKTGRLPGELVRLLNFAEVFAHGTGVAVILLAAVALDSSLTCAPAERGGRTSALGCLRPTRDFFRLIAAATAGGITVDIIKAIVDRVRPRAVDLTAVTSALATFGTGAAERITSHSDINSFPSGHAATAAGLAAGLSWKYPRAAWLFVALAIAAAAQRVVASAHYPSDVLTGAALGLVGAALFLGVPPDQSRTSD